MKISYNVDRYNSRYLIHDYNAIIEDDNNMAIINCMLSINELIL